MNQPTPGSAASKLDGLLADGRPLTWITTGDSVALGARWTRGHRDYVQWLEERVRYELGRTEDVFGRTAVSGWTTSDVLGDLDRVERLRPDIVVVGVGIGDAKRARPISDFRADYAEILERIRAMGALALAQLPNGVRPDADPSITANLPTFVDAAHDIAGAAGAVVVDHFAVWTVRDDGWGPAEWMADSIHPNDAGHRVLAHTLFRSCGLWDEQSECCQLVDRDAG